MNLSVALATFNEKDNLEQCLKSVFGWSDEIVIVDGGSTDETRVIAEKYHANVITADNPAIFHINKQKAVDACKGSWVLQLDADEVITNELKNEIKNILEIKDKTNGFNGYFIPRKNFFLGKWMKKGGLYPDYVIRLFKNKHGSFPCRSVHEQIKINGTIGYLKHPMIHNTAPTLKLYWTKASRYILLGALEHKRNKAPKDFRSAINFLIIQPGNIFFDRIIRHKGIFDGWHGILFAFFSAVQVPMAFIKYLKSSNAE